jgi:integrase
MAAKVMAMAKALTVKGVSAQMKPGRYPDGEVRGLILQVKEHTNEKTGVVSVRRSWILRYQINKKTHWFGLGPLHEVGLKEAREAAREARGKLRSGIDPIQEKKERKAALAKAAAELTFEQCALQWHSDNSANWKDEKEREKVLRSLKKYAFPVLGKMLVKDVDTPAVLRALKQEWDRIPDTMGRVRRRIESVLAWSTVNGHRQGDNPAQWTGHLKQGGTLIAPQNVKKPKNFAALPYAEVPAFMAELRAQQGVAPRALEFCILTAARSGTVLGAVWDEIDLYQKIWTIPAERMKADKPHTVPLTDAAIAALALPLALRRDDNPHVFIGQRRGKSIGVRAMLNMIDDMKRTDITVHGFRSTFRDWAGDETHHSREVCEAALAHSVGGKVERAYRRGDALAKRRKLMEEWSDYCCGKQRGGKVVAFAR